MSLSCEEIIKEFTNKLPSNRLFLEGDVEIVTDFRSGDSKTTKVNNAEKFIRRNELIKHIARTYKESIKPGESVQCVSVITKTCDFISNAVSREELIKELNKNLHSKRLIFKGEVEIIAEFARGEKKVLKANIDKEFIHSNEIMNHVVRAYDTLVKTGEGVQCISIVAKTCDFVQKA